VTCRDGEDHWPDVNCHENGESAHEKSTTYEQIAVFMLRVCWRHMTPVVITTRLEMPESQSLLRRTNFLARLIRLYNPLPVRYWCI